MKFPKFLTSNNISNNLKTHSSPFSTRSKSSNKRHPRNSSPSKKPKPKQSSPSLYQRITDLVGAEDPALSLSKDDLKASNPSTQVCTPTVCQNAQESSTIPKEDAGPIVHKITRILRAENSRMPVERGLEEMGAISFSSEIVEKVLKRCFKVGHLALRFFDWVKLRHGFCHNTETYNVMIYIAGEAGDFDLVEKLLREMDEGSCSKNIKTWTIVISHYCKAKRISKALSAFEEMTRSRCELDFGVYEAILRGLVMAGKSELAMEFYKEMVSKHVEVVDINLYELLIVCLCRSGDVAAARAIGDDMTKSLKVSESEGYTRIMKSFCVSGKIDEAQALLEEIKRKNVVVDSKPYEVLLKGLCSARRIDEAMEVVNGMKKFSAVDGKLHSFLIDGFLRNGDISKAMELLSSMRKLNCVPMISTYTHMVQHLLRSNEYRKACEVYEDMIENGIEPDVVAITAMVAGHIQNKRISEALELFDSMKKKSVNFTSKAYSVIIKELCKASNPNEAFKLLNEMAASNLNPSEYIFGLVISSLMRTGEVEKAKIVKEMSKSFKPGKCLENRRVYQGLDDQPIHCSSKHEDLKPVQTLKEYNDRDMHCSSDHEDLKPMQTLKEYNDHDLMELSKILSSSTDWNSMEEVLGRSTVYFTPELVVAVLNSCKKQGRVALNFFAWLAKKENYRHTTDTYNLAIKISGCGKDFKHMRELYREMKRNRCLITPNTWTIMIAQYGQAGLTEIAMKTFKEMKLDGFQPNASTFKYLLMFICRKKGQKLEDAIKIFHEMMQKGFIPDRETVEVYISSLCEAKKVVDAKNCVKSLLKKEFAKQLGYSLLVKSLCRAGEIEEALTVTKEMELDGCIIDQFIYGSIVHALLRKKRLNEALEKVESMKRAGISESAHIQTSFLVHFCKEKDIGKALEIFKRIKEPSLVTYSAMIRGYMNMGMTLDAWGIFRHLKAEGPNPDFETYSMFISCLCKMGKSEDGLELVHDMIKSGIIPSAVNFRTVFHGLNREGKQELAHSVLQTKWKLKRQRMFSM